MYIEGSEWTHPPSTGIPVGYITIIVIDFRRHDLHNLKQAQTNLISSSMFAGAHGYYSQDWGEWDDNHLHIKVSVQPAAEDGSQTIHWEAALGNVQLDIGYSYFQYCFWHRRQRVLLGGGWRNPVVRSSPGGMWGYPPWLLSSPFIPLPTIFPGSQSLWPVCTAVRRPVYVAAAAAGGPVAVVTKAFQRRGPAYLRTKVSPQAAAQYLRPRLCWRQFENWQSQCWCPLIKQPGYIDTLFVKE